MTELGSRKLHICTKVAKMGSIAGHRTDYNGVGAMRLQRYIPKNYPGYPLSGEGGGVDELLLYCIKLMG